MRDFANVPDRFHDLFLIVSQLLQIKTILERSETIKNVHANGQER